MKKLMYTLLLALSAATGAYGMEEPNYGKMLDEGAKLFEQRKYAEAEKVFKVVANQNEDKPRKAIALYDLGLTAQRQYKKALAIEYYKAASDQNENLPIKYQAMWSITDLLYNLSEISEKVKYLKLLAEQNVDMELKVNAKAKLRALKI